MYNKSLGLFFHPNVFLLLIFNLKFSIFNRENLIVAT